MSVELLGAVNRLTAAVLALAVEHAKDGDTEYEQAAEGVEDNYEERLEFLME